MELGAGQILTHLDRVKVGSVLTTVDRVVTGTSDAPILDQALSLVWRVENHRP